MNKMKKLNLIYLISGLVGLLYYNTNSIIQSFSFYTNGSKKVVILGDCHPISLEKEIIEREKNDSGALTTALNNLSKQSKNINFILEASANGSYMFELRQEPRGSLLNAGLIAIHNKLKLGAINYSFADYRPENYSLSCNFFVSLIDILANNENPNLEVLKQAFKNNYNFNPLTGKFINEIDQLLVKLSKESTSLGILSPAQNYLNALYKIVENGWKETKDVLNKYNAGQELTKTIIDIALERNIDKIRHCSFINYNFGNFYTYLADIGYIIELSKSLKTYDNLIIYVGVGHTPRLDQFLTNLNFTPQIYKIINEPAKSLDCLFTDINELPSILSNIFNSDNSEKAAQAQNVTASALDVTTNLENRARRCPNCLSHAAKRCGRCRKAYYCSAECQKENWALHKVNCNVANT